MNETVQPTTDTGEPAETIHHVTRYGNMISCGATGPVAVTYVRMEVTCEACDAADDQHLVDVAHEQAIDEDAEHEPAEPTGYAATAVELRRIADALDTLPPVDKPPYVTMGILPDGAEAVDAVARSVIGEPGLTERVLGDWYRIARGEGSKTNVWVTVQDTVPGPPDERDVELERLRAELAEARAAADPDHGRTTAVAEAKPDTLGIAMGRAAVPPLAERIAESMAPIGAEPELLVHLDAPGAMTRCGLAIIDLDAGVGWTNDNDAVTCKDCRTGGE